MRAPSLLVLALACGTAPASPPPAARVSGIEAPVVEHEWERATIPEILHETARRSCVQHARCRSYQCVPVGALTEVCHPARVDVRIAQVLEQLDQGEAFFDRARALEVLDELAAGTCRTHRISTRCDVGLDRTFDGLRGTHRLGERCDSDAVCQSGRCARGERGGGLCTDGVVRPLEDGANNCESSLDCKPGRICSVNRGCVVPLVRGADCERVGRFSACGDALVCTSAGCADGTPLGGRCSNGATMDPCAHGLYCDGERCITPGVPWGACGSSDHCPEAFECRRGRCELMPMVGEPCENECIDGYCVDGRCVPVTVGERCTGEIFGGRMCQPGSDCDLRRGRCEVTP
ncbi:MAG: hypothetical protein AAGE52_30280 [Myxococcota bacterium]